MALGALDIIIAADTAQLRKGMDTAVGIMQSSTQKMDAHARQVQRTIENTSGAIKTLGLSFLSLESFKGLSTIADSMTNVNSKLKLVTDSNKELISAQKELFDLSQNTRVQYAGTVDLYSRISRSTRDQILSQKDLLDLTGTINKSMVISGGTAESMNAAIIQLGQAFSADFKAVGQELGSIREQTPRLYQAMIDGSGMSSAAFKKAAEDGKLSTKIIIDALKSQSTSVDSEYATMNKTIEQSGVTFKNSLVNVVGKLDEATGASRAFSDTITGMSQSMDNMDIQSIADTFSNYSSVLQGVAIATGVMYTSTKGAALVEGIYASAKEISTAATASNAAIIAAETKAQQMGTYAQTIRAAADRASAEAKLSNLIMAERHAMMLAKEATEAELAALAQTKNAYAMREAGASAGLMGTALKAIPFLAVAGTVATLATWFFESTKRSDDLRSSLNATAESLAKLTAAQLTNKRQNLALESQDLSLEIRKLKQEYGAKKGRTTDEQAEIDDLEAQYRELGTAMKLVAQAQTDIRNGVKNVKIDPIANKILPPSLTPPTSGKSPKLTQAEKDAKELAAMEQRMFDERMNDGIKRLQDEMKLHKDEIKSQEKFNHDIAQGQLSAITNRTLAHQDGVLKIEAAERALSMKMLDISGDWYTAESVRIGEQYIELEKTVDDKLRLQQFLSDSMAALDKERIEKLKNDTIKLNTVFEDAFKSMEDSMVNMFMTGKFSAEDFFNTVIEGMIRMQIRNSITQPLMTAIGGIDFSTMFAAYDGGMIPYYSGGAVNNFAYGGYTGDGWKYEPKGVVHGGEYVIPQWMVQKSPALIGSLESTRKRGYADGGFVGSALSSASAPSMPVTINIENKSGAPISAENTDVRFDGKGMIVSVVVDAINRDVGGMRSAIRSVR